MRGQAANTAKSNQHEDQLARKVCVRMPHGGFPSTRSLVAALVFLAGLIGAQGCATTVFTVVRTEPPDASVQVTVPHAPWNLAGQSPISVRFTAASAAQQMALIRVSKAGYYTEEKMIPFSSLPAEVEIRLRRVEEEPVRK